MQLDGRSSKVVVADNDRTILELLQIRLDVAGYHAIGVRNGTQAMEMLQTLRPSAMVLDLNLPDIDGFEVLRAMQARPKTIPFPILVIGRKLAMDDVKRAISLGARDCMAKPFSGADILDRVARMLSRPAPAPQPVQYVA